MGSGAPRDQVPHVGTDNRGADDLPLADRRDRNLSRNTLLERFGNLLRLGQIGVADGLLRGRVRDRAIFHAQRHGSHFPPLGCKMD